MQMNREFSKKVVNSSDLSLIEWDWPPVEDKGVVDAKLLFAGPMIPDFSDTSHKKSYIQFKEEPQIKKKLMTLPNTDCKVTKDKFAELF